LYLNIGYEHKYTETEILKTVEYIDEMDVGYVSLDFDNLDRFLGKNIVSFGYYFGDVEPDGDPLLPPFRQGFHKRFDYLTLNMARIQKLYGYMNFTLKAGGQISDDRLLSTEQKIIGGYTTVRGHDPSLFLGDSGYNVTGELMTAPPFLADKNLFGQRIAQMMQFAFFYDFAGVFINDLVEDDPYRNEYLEGYGCGLRLFYKDIFSFKYDLGFPVRRVENEAERYNYFQFAFNFF